MEDGMLSWGNAYAGSYTLEVFDESGIYAPLYADFILNTDELPVVYNEETSTLIAAEGYESAAAEAFIKNIETVSVNGEEYKAKGKGAAMIIDQEGWVDSGAVLIKD